MSGPIVRTGATPEFWKNWDSIFGDKKGKSSAEETKEAKPKKQAAAKAPKAKAKTAKKKTSKAKK